MDKDIDIDKELERIENASDEEILEMVRAEGEDPTIEAERIRSLLLKAVDEFYSQQAKGG